MLLQDTARLDILSGIGNGFFRSLPSLRIEGSSQPTGLLLSDLKDDGRTDLVLQDISDVNLGLLTVVINDVTGVLEEADTFAVPGGFTTASGGNLVTEVADYDRDGIINQLDNCPTRYNPPGCPVTDPACRVEIDCTDTGLAPVDCTTVDPTTLQCDSDGNGIGDQCQVLDSVCLFIDSDFDLTPDYDPSAIVGDDSNQFNQFVCRDVDSDTCDDCSAPLGPTTPTGPPTTHRFGRRGALRRWGQLPDDRQPDADRLRRGHDRRRLRQLPDDRQPDADRLRCGHPWRRVRQLSGDRQPDADRRGRGHHRRCLRSLYRYRRRPGRRSGIPGEHLPARQLPDNGQPHADRRGHGRSRRCL